MLLLTYPAGFQGWTASTAPSGSYVTTGTLGADRVLVANSTAATSSGNIHNYNGKIGFKHRITRSYHWIGYQNYR
jgi:hypothetical protein